MKIFNKFIVYLTFSGFAESTYRHIGTGKNQNFLFTLFNKLVLPIFGTDTYLPFSKYFALLRTKPQTK